MNREEIQRQIKNLRQEIRYHDYQYYVLDKPVISDRKYDNLMQQLIQLEEQYPDLVTPDSPTQRVGGTPLDKFSSVRHIIPMLSLDTALTSDDIHRFDDRIHREMGLEDISYLCEPKLDGLSVELLYENGELIRGATRGDGIEGEDITENIKTIKSVPLRLRQDEMSAPKRLAVRGEVIMTLHEFEKVNRELIEQGEEPLANPRNAAAGALRRLDPRETAKRPLDIFIYDIMAVDDLTIATQKEGLTYLKKWGLKTTELTEHCPDIECCRRYHKKMEEKREQLPYEIDGIVIKVNQKDHQTRLGIKTRSPRWAVAFKFPPRQEKTQVMDIMTQVGRTGILTPIALLKPVDVTGVTVSRASLHNQDFITQKDVRIGDTVRVARAGDVIPEVVEVLPETRTGQEKKFQLPSHCPICGSQVIQDGAYFRCTGGLSCNAQVKRSITHFSSKSAMDIDTLGKKTVNLLVDQGHLTRISDIYHLKKEHLVDLPGFADKSAEVLLEAIEESKKRSLPHFIYGLGIPHVGEHVAQVLADTFKSLEALMDATLEDLMAIPEIGPEISESVVMFFNEEHNREEIQRLRQVHLQAVRERVTEKPPGILQGKIFVFTGALRNYSRDDAKQIVETLGGKTAATISKRVDYVVVGDNPGSKYEQAQQLGIPLLSETEFQMMIAS